MDIRSFGSVQSGTIAERAAPVAVSPVPGPRPVAAAAHPAAEVQQPTPVPSEDQVSQALKSVNTVLQARTPGLEFTVDSESDRTIVKVVDKKTQEVIRQMPSEEAIQIAKALDQLQSLLVRQSA